MMDPRDRPQRSFPAGPRRRSLLLAAALVLGAAGAAGGDPTPLPRPAGPAPASVTAAAAPDVSAAARDLFAMPAIVAATREAELRLAAGDPDGAAAVLDRLIAAHPTVGALQAARAALFLIAGAPGPALDRLEAAAGLGYGAAALAADPLFAPLAADPAARRRLAALAASAAAPAPAPPPAPLSGGAAPVGAGNTAWDPATGWLEARFAVETPASGDVLGRQRGDNAYDLLRDLFSRGRAAGNAGDLYDNRDRGHSRLPAKNHPQLGAVVYGAAAREADVDYGLADRIRFGRPTLGNSSTAVTAGPFWRSLGRDALTRPDGGGPLRLSQDYAANRVYVYPSHRDYGPERGDLFPANTPYLLVSEGSSRSDQPFLEALAMIFAAFRPETKARLVETGLLAPTAQYVFRRSQRSVLSREAYLSGAAHPSVFPAYEIGLARMVSLANAILPGDIPPLVRIRMLEETEPVEGVDFFGEGLSEAFFDTPAAIGRIWRGKDFSRSYLVSAEETADPNGRPLSFEWRLLRGDPGRVRVTPLGDGRRARIEVDWQEPRPIGEENPVRSARVDVGVFANNGVHDSAPAILSLLFPAHETRRYEPGPDGAPRIAAIDHADPAKAGVYADPMLMARADWRDDYRYDPAGVLLGWTRSRPGRHPESFRPDGARAFGGAAEAVAYPLARAPDGRLLVEERSAPGPSP
jgi:hypothetical protein